VYNIFCDQMVHLCVKKASHKNYGNINEQIHFTVWFNLTFIVT